MSAGEPTRPDADEADEAYLSDNDVEELVDDEGGEPMDDDEDGPIQEVIELGDEEGEGEGRGLFHLISTA